MSAALRPCWHAVAYGGNVGAEPVAVTLLGEALVLWRDGEGALRCFRDRCVHRGTALSLGRVENGQLVCPYHGWRFEGGGRCVHIPQLEDPTRVPPKACVEAFRAVERYGLVWVALEAPRWPLPEVAEFSDPAWHIVRTGPFAWNANASRMLENFTDFGHFPWVHPGLLGDPTKPVIAPYTVETDGAVLRYAYGRPDQKNTESLPVFAAEERKSELRRTRYVIHLPYTLVEHIDWGAADAMVYLFVVQPVADAQAIGYCLVARNYHHEQDASVMQDFEATIFEQDRRIVESQRPVVAPFDPHAEMHLKFDAVALAYRRAMRAHGLG
ncbi:MAG: aromatic ring-hydroxylating dioxygenase subunit alpha [Proteobacteria bacterium]|nr:aromatic ring-hydroxylating dioxygenase subunit alpha [Pseudomonadota bacterium]